MIKKEQKIRINQFIRASELRVIGSEGENLGIMPTNDALAKARESGLDLVEISPNATPPIAKIVEFGKYLYQENKKQKAAKAKAHTTEVKNIQVRIGTDENDLNVKAKKAVEWLNEGHRIKIELFLPGRTKYMDKNFLKERLEKILKLLTVDFKITDPMKPSPKGLAMIIEKSK